MSVDHFSLIVPWWPNPDPPLSRTRPARLLRKSFDWSMIGRVRALLSFSEEGEPFLHLRDQNDTHRVWMGISNDTGVVVRDTDGKTRLVLSLDAQGEPSLVVRDRQHRTKSFHP